MLIVTLVIKSMRIVSCRYQQIDEWKYCLINKFIIYCTRNWVLKWWLDTSNLIESLKHYDRLSSRYFAEITTHCVNSLKCSYLHYSEYSIYFSQINVANSFTVSTSPSEFNNRVAKIARLLSLSSVF